jgi:hypothetical protein
LGAGKHPTYGYNLNFFLPGKLTKCIPAISYGTLLAVQTKWTGKKGTTIDGDWISGLNFKKQLA